MIRRGVLHNWYLTDVTFLSVVLQLKSLLYYNRKEKLVLIHRG